MGSSEKLASTTLKPEPDWTGGSSEDFSVRARAKTAGWPMLREEPALPSLLLVHLAEPANETGTNDCALSQSCGGSALKLSAFAAQTHDAGLRAT